MTSFLPACQLGKMRAGRRADRSTGMYVLQSVWKLSPFANGVTGFRPFANGLTFQAAYKQSKPFVIRLDGRDRFRLCVNLESQVHSSFRNGITTGWHHCNRKTTAHWLRQIRRRVGTPQQEHPTVTKRVHFVALDKNDHSQGKTYHFGEVLLRTKKGWSTVKGSIQSTAHAVLQSWVLWSNWVVGEVCQHVPPVVL